MPERVFFYNFEFFCYCFRNFLSRVEYERNSGVKSFSLFLGLSHPVWLGIMQKSGFLIFWIILLFFSEFIARVKYERNSGLKFFSHFLGLPHPVLSRNNAEKRFFDFLNFFAIFVGILLPRSSMNRIRD